ncbi:MAG: hypothetical protein E2576_11080 [Alcaligenaceae bacterium]|nr:hypothetical protein [Alcaligenaceae bacterium SAGV5]MPS51249.1 hypothetical protein [Alcaligenaceae bacterium SAGV3]MPT57254.1 hypothetical protein [Alcaligenaceae bacterium]
MFPFDFKAVAAAALNRAESLVPEWLPQGHRAGPEWRCGNLRGDPGNSLAVNLTTGVWADFSTDDDKGSDLISLYAAIFCNGDQAASCREVAQRLGIQPKPASASEVAAPSKKPARTPWTPVLPVPASAGTAPVAHPVRGRSEMRWEYLDAAGQLLGVVHRFRTSDGGKEVLPCVWARHDEHGREEWRWLAFPEPRPLYGLQHAPPSDTGLFVEGEKCVDSAREEVGGWFDVLSWPGGGKAVDKANWELVRDRGLKRVILFPDADAKRVKGPEPEDQRPLLPAEKQPGIATMERIAKKLMAMGIEVRIVDVGAPGDRPDGWDIHDAIAEGLRGAALRDWIITHLRQPAVDDSAAADSASPPPPAGAARGNWRRRLLAKPRGGVEDCKENVAILLEDHPDLSGLIAYNEFSGFAEKRKAPPWPTDGEEWTEDDDRELSMFVAQECDILFRSTGTIGEGVSVVANRNRFHPVRDWLKTLAWDGVDRNSAWLIHGLGVEDTAYTRLVGPLWLREAVNRILIPGCKGDYALILEGSQGKGKSTALRVLGGEWFSDAPLDISNKDAYMALRGVWIYEIAELDAFNKAETTKVKAFMSMAEDRYRPPYGSRFVTRARQTVFAGTTNNDEYFKDPTGNRRFWPVYCHAVDLEWIAQNRLQLFAQALHEVRQGLPCYPTREQEVRLIMPEQQKREIVDPWVELIQQWVGMPERAHEKDFSTAQILMGAIGMPADRMDGQRSAATRVGICMKKLGWGKHRGSDGDSRPWLYRRPDKSPPSGSQQAGGGHASIPF